MVNEKLYFFRDILFSLQLRTLLKVKILLQNENMDILKEVAEENFKQGQHNWLMKTWVFWLILTQVAEFQTTNKHKETLHMTHITRKMNFAYDSNNGCLDSNCGLCGRRIELTVPFQLVAFVQRINEDGYDMVDVCQECVERMEPWILKNQPPNYDD